MMDVRFCRLKSILALKGLNEATPVHFCDLVVSYQINFEAYYILFHKPLNACIFLSDIFRLLKKPGLFKEKEKR